MDDLTVAAQPCATCLALPRRAHWSWLRDVPGGYFSLVDTIDGHAKCPACSTLYRRSYEESYEDMAHYESWTLERLTPTEASASDDAMGHWWKAHYAAEIAKHRAWLEHGDARARANAGWVVATHAVAERDWAAMFDLLHRADRDAAQAAAEALSARQVEGVEVPDEVFGGPGDALPVLAAVRARTCLRGRPEVVLQLLNADDPAVVEAVVREVDSEHREGLEIGPYFDAVLELCGDSASGTRQVAGWIVGRVSDPSRVERVARFATRLLDHSDSDIRASACRILRGVASTPAAGDAVGRLAELVAQRQTHWEANHALAALARANVNIGPAVSVVVGRVTDKKGSPDAIDLELLETMRAAGYDVSAAAEAISNTVFEAGTGKVQFLSLHLLIRLIEDGVVAPALLGRIEERLAPLYGGQGEPLGRAVAKVRLREENWESLRLLLASSSAVAWATIDVLREAVEEGRDIAPAIKAVSAIVDTATGALENHARALISLFLYPPFPHINLKELQRRLRELRQEVRYYSAWNEEYVANPHSPRDVLGELVALGPAVAPALCALARDAESSELRYWAIVGLGTLGRDAGTDAVATLETLTGDPYSGRTAAEAIGMIDEERFFALGFHEDTQTVNGLTRDHVRRGTLTQWLGRLVERGHEPSLLTALEALWDFDSENEELVALIRGAQSSPFFSVRARADRLLAGR